MLSGILIGGLSVAYFGGAWLLGANQEPPVWDWKWPWDLLIHIVKGNPEGPGTD